MMDFCVRLTLMELLLNYAGSQLLVEGLMANILKIDVFHVLHSIFLDF